MSEEVAQDQIENVPQAAVEQPINTETNEQPIVEEPINSETTETVDEVVIDTEGTEAPVEVEEAATETTEPSTEDQTFTTANDMVVEEETKEPEREPLNEPTLHISGLPVTVKASELAPILESYGEVTKIVILPPKTIYQSYGFVSYETKEEAQKCLDSLNNTKFVFDNQYTWKVNWARQGPMKMPAWGLQEDHTHLQTSLELHIEEVALEGQRRLQRGKRKRRIQRWQRKRRLQTILDQINRLIIYIFLSKR